MKSILRTQALSLAASILLAAQARAGNVVLVNGGGFALQAAIDVAAEGDTLLVAPDSYYSARVLGKSLTITADVVGGVTIADGLAVRNLVVGQRCVVAGLSIWSSGGFPAIEVTNCAGSVRIESVLASAGVGSNGISVLSSSDVALERCTVQGGAGAQGMSTSVAGVGCLGTSSQVALYDCTVTGGPGRDSQIFGFPFTLIPAGDGERGVHVDAASVVCLRGTTVRGGAGGDGVGLFCHTLGALGPTPGGDGGPGIQVDASAAAHAIDGSIVGGAGGTGGAGGLCHGTTYGQAPNGSTGAAIVGAVNNVPGAHVTLVGPYVVREGQSLGLAITGTPGHTAFLASSTQSRWSLNLPFGGVFLYGPTARRIQLGTIGGGGLLNATLPVPFLPVGVQADLRFLQLVTRDPVTAHVELGSPLSLTILDGAF